MPSALIIFSALNPVERANWQVQNLFRQAGERAELQTRRFFEALQGVPFPLEDAAGSLEPILTWAVRILVALFAAAVLLWSRQAIRQWLRRRRRRSVAPTEVAIAQDLAQQDWLDEAQVAQAQGNYTMACRALYMAFLLRLEETDWLPQDPALTNQEYLQRLDALAVLYAKTTELPTAWGQLFQTHERIYYGAQTASAETFQRCQAAYQQLTTGLVRPAQT